MMNEMESNENGKCHAMPLKTYMLSATVWNLTTCRAILDILWGTADNAIVRLRHLLYSIQWNG
jgi:hypothetical protein